MPQDPSYNHLATMRLKEKLNTTSQVPYKPRENSRFTTLVQEIFSNYTGIFDQPHPASEFGHLYTHHSPPTIQKAKKLLGIKSVRRNYVWWWTAPTRTPSQAIAQLEGERSAQHSKKMGVPSDWSRESVQLMQGLMVSAGYCSSNASVTAEMKRAGYGRSTIMHCKRDLGIASIYKEGEWLWVQCPQEAVDWLKGRLALGPKLMSILASEAPWHPEVIRLACMQPRGFMMRLTSRGYEVVDLNSRHTTSPYTVATVGPELEDINEPIDVNEPDKPVAKIRGNYSTDLDEPFGLPELDGDESALLPPGAEVEEW